MRVVYTHVFLNLRVKVCVVACGVRALEGVSASPRPPFFSNRCLLGGDPQRVYTAVRPPSTQVKPLNTHSERGRAWKEAESER